jgi:hydrogenase maturation protein HypF
MERRAFVVRGIVQGVGFRPFVFHLAARHHLAGFVKNQTGSVLIEVEGETPSLEQFAAELSHRPPPLAHIEDFSWHPLSPRGERGFRIELSEADPTSPVFISPDVAVCPDCLAELFDPADRRYRYPFLNCTNCGPRLTIITGAPYDRRRSTMTTFALCPACAAEYADPHNRRFHAQPTACATCGPRLELLDTARHPLAAADPVASFAAALRGGKIGALKGLGGYHLACLAADPAAVAKLRRRKHRDEKPFAVMVPDAGAAAALAEVGTAEQALLQSPQTPIVLLRKRLPSPVAEEVAPGNPYLGILLPYTPLHHLLMRAVGGVPLVMTSGNRSDEPIAYGQDAPEQLRGIADLFLTHNRPIHIRCDDSVTRVVDGVELPVRRSRGYAPRPVELPFACPRPLLAVGGQLKVTFALGRDRQAFLSHHMGDLDHYEAFRAFSNDVALYERLFAVRPEAIAHDLHPDYATTRYADERMRHDGTALLVIQHHHAHLASCMAEHELDEPVLGVTFDGTGLGTDGAVWGGEFLLGDYRQFTRVAHLRYVAMPGGEQAIREPWRMAVSHLADAGVQFAPLRARLLPISVRTVERMLERRLNAPSTSSAGRLFDAVAALVGLRDTVSYEGQAAMELEFAAARLGPDGVYPFDLVPPAAGNHAPVVVDTRPVIQAVADEVAKGVLPARIARRFHSTMVEVIVAVCNRLRQQTGIGVVALSGGVFLNTLLTSETGSRLVREGFRVYRHRLVPPGDGGLSLGQLAIAAARLNESIAQGSNDVPGHPRQGG